MGESSCGWAAAIWMLWRDVEGFISQGKAQIGERDGESVTVIRENENVMYCDRERTATDPIADGDAAEWSGLERN